LWQYDYPDAWILAQGHAQERGIKPSVISQVGRSPEALMTGLVEGRNGLNLARGVGGRDYKEFLSTHPKVSVTEVRVGDVLIVASDGWTDALPQTFQGMGEVLQGGSPQWVAEQLAQQGALTRDNVTVIVIWFR
jgi:serine/threonine protein phosphatase PrpC